MTPQLQNRTRNIDGVITKPASGYRGPAGPLHARYVNRDKSVAPAAVPVRVAAPMPPQAQMPQPQPLPRKQIAPRPAPVAVAPVSAVPPVTKAPAPVSNDAPRLQVMQPAMSRHRPQAPAPSSQPTVATRQPRPHEQVQPSGQPEATSADSQKKPKAKKEGISTVWLVAAASIAGLAVFSVVAGQIAIALYAIVALWRRIPSHQSFILALVMFAAIIVVSLIPSSHDVAGNLAVYAFMLLCVGAISLGLEARRGMREVAASE